MKPNVIFVEAINIILRKVNGALESALNQAEF